MVRLVSHRIEKKEYMLPTQPYGKIKEETEQLSFDMNLKHSVAIAIDLSSSWYSIRNTQLMVIVVLVAFMPCSSVEK